MRTSFFSRKNGNSFSPQGKQDKGMPCVMALLDDVVTGVLPLAPAANEPTDDAEETR